MRLYSFSNDTYTFAEVKWVKAKVAITAILVGAVVLFGIVKLNQPVAQANGSRSVQMLAAENRILRYQLRLISPRISAAELEVSQLEERVNSFRAMFNRRVAVGDTAWRFTDATKGTTSRPVVSSARIF